MTALRRDGRRPIDPQEALDLVNSARWAAPLDGAKDECWLWTAGLNSIGYADTSINGRHLVAHRVALVAHLGRDLRDAMEAGHVCHDLAYADGSCVATDREFCDHRRCVNPAHLVEQSRRENVRAVNIRCPKGHSLTPETRRPSGNGCGICYREAARHQQKIIRSASRALGLTIAEYTSRYGWSKSVALAIAESA